MIASESWLAAFVLTQLVEVPIYYRALSGRRSRLAWAFGASALTHPFVYLVLPRVWPGTWAGYVAAAEALAVVVEAGYLSLLGVSRPLLWSLAANLASTLAGLLIRAI